MHRESVTEHTMDTARTRSTSQPPLVGLLAAPARQLLDAGLRTLTMANAAAGGATALLGRLAVLSEPHMRRALNALQIPTASDVRALAERVEELNATLSTLAARNDAVGQRRRKGTAPRKRRTKGARPAPAD